MPGSLENPTRPAEWELTRQGVRVSQVGPFHAPQPNRNLGSMVGCQDSWLTPHGGGRRGTGHVHAAEDRTSGAPAPRQHEADLSAAPGSGCQWPSESGRDLTALCLSFLGCKMPALSGLGPLRQRWSPSIAGV